MGCTTTQKQRQQIAINSTTAAGVLVIKIINGVFTHDTSTFKMDPYVILKLSNQNFTSKVVAKGGKKPNFNEQFIFFINGYYQQYGRNLQLKLMDKNKILGDNLIGFGMVDVNPIIKQIKNAHQFRCMLNYEYKQAGFLNLIAQFREQPVDIIHFRFEQAVIRRETSTFGAANCWIQVTVGEQTMRTHKHKNNKKKSLSWLTQVLTFRTIKSIQKCTIRAMDDSVQIGHLQMQLSQILASEEQLTFVKDVVYDKGLYAGTIKFRTIKGKAPSFSHKRYTQKLLTISDEQKVQSLQKAYFSSKTVEQFQTNPTNPYVKQFNN